MVSSFLRCPQKYHFEYVDKLRRKQPSKPLTFGTDFHRLLEVRGDNKKVEEVMQDISNTYNSLSDTTHLGETYLDDLRTIFEDYMELYKDCELPIKTEHKFKIFIGTYAKKDIFFTGTIDEIYNNLMLGEHKTFSKKPDIGLLHMNMQVCLYAKAYELEFKEKIKRVQWDYTRSCPAESPKWLEKSQKFTTTIKSNVTPFSYIRTCKNLGIQDKDILDKCVDYTNNTENYFFRRTVELIPQIVDTNWKNFIQVTKNIVAGENKYKVKNIIKDCSWCEYRSICYAEFTGVDTNYIIKKDFIKEV